jgi:hypothetical protein
MYAKVFAQMFDSSLREKWQAWVTFVALLALADANDEVDMTIEALRARTGLPGTIIPEGIAFLEAPDEHSRSPEEGGRRIVRLDEHRPWGWRIVNRGKYKVIRDNAERRDYFREQKRAKRAACPPMSTAVHPCPPQAVGSRQETRDKETKPTPARAPRSPRFEGSASKAENLELPAWLPAPAWASWCEFRRSIKNTPFSLHAANLSIRELGKFRATGDDPTAVIERSILNGWKGLFALPKEEKQRGGFVRPEDPMDMAARVRAQMRQEERQRGQRIEGENRQGNLAQRRGMGGNVLVDFQIPQRQAHLVNAKDQPMDSMGSGQNGSGHSGNPSPGGDRKAVE